MGSICSRANLGLEVKGKTKDEKLKNTISVYNRIIEIENNKLKQKDIQQAIKDFKEYFPEYNLSDIKIWIIYYGIPEIKI